MIIAHSILLLVSTIILLIIIVIEKRKIETGKKDKDSKLANIKVTAECYSIYFALIVALLLALKLVGKRWIHMMETV